MKKVLSILILSAMCVHLAGFYAYFVVRQNQIRQEMRETIGTLPHEDFERFVFTKDEYNKIRVNDHEVRINGQMYDHSTPIFEGDKIVLLARHDEAEDNLISFFQELIESTTQDEKPIPSQLTTFLSLTFITQPDLLLPSLQGETIKYLPLEQRTLKPLRPVESPPPRLS
ncbi:MAG: hypothetical protein RLN86_07905 [Cyclobacteriaceae bacterium]